MSIRLLPLLLLHVSIFAQTEGLQPVAVETEAGVNLWGNSTTIYKATSTVLVTDKFFRQDFIKAEQNVNPTKADFAYFVAVAKSNAIIMLVDQRLTDEMRDRFMESLPQDSSLDDISQMEALSRCVQVESNYEELTIRFTSAHPDSLVAAKLANLFAKETIDYRLKYNIETLIKRVEDLRVGVYSWRERVEKLGDSTMTDTTKIDYDQAKKLYSELVYELKLAELQVGLVNRGAMILDEAIAPDEPGSPSKSR